MQPVSVIGYGAALAWSGTPSVGAVGARVLACLLAAALVGTGSGLLLRGRVDPARVVLLIRVVAAAASALLVL